MKHNLVFDVNLGTESFVKNRESWETEKINDFLFFSRKDINQKIRLGTKVETFADTLTFYQDGQILPKNVKWVNSYKNLNPILFNVNKKEEGYREHLVYITMDSSLKLLRFRTFFSILQTYHKVNEYQGCVIVIPEKSLDPEKPIMELTVKNTENNRYQYIKIYLPDNAEVTIDQQDVRNRKQVNDLRKLDNRKSHYHFKIKVPKGTLLTNTYICNNSSDFNRMMELTDDIKNRSIVNISLFEGEEQKSVINEKLLGSNVRAFTIVNDAQVPYELWKENKQLYVFKYNTEDETVTCLKSN